MNGYVCHLGLLVPRQCSNELAGMKYILALVSRDNIFLYCKTFGKNFLTLNLYSNAAKKKTLQLSLKSTLCKGETTYLGFFVSAQGVKPNFKKLEAVLKFSVPKDRKTVCQFLGLDSHYRSFIRNYASVHTLCKNLYHKKPNLCGERRS